MKSTRFMLFVSLVAAATGACSNSETSPGPNTPEQGDEDEITNMSDGKVRGLADSPSVIGHFRLDRQSSVEHRGPESDDIAIQVQDLIETAGEDIGVSPWHVLSAKRYNSDDIRTIWGSSLTHVYKWVVDEDSFTFADAFELNAEVIPTTLPWNLVSLDDGRVMVPDPDGYRNGNSDDPCSGTDPALLIFRDDEDETGDPSSPIYCEKKIDLSPSLLTELCDPPNGLAMDLNRSGTNMTASTNGDIITTVIFGSGAQAEVFMVVVDNDLSEIRNCASIGVGAISNQAPVEALGDDASEIYYGLDNGSIVKMVYNHTDNTITKRWQRELSLRRRTGTTPTFVNTSDGRRYIVLVDATCAVVSVTNGLIVCDDGNDPSELVAVRREDDVPESETVQRVALPNFIQTVENSPPAYGDYVVVANYSGYLPNGLLVPPGGEKPEGSEGEFLVSPDAVEDFAKGMVALRYDTEQKAFEVVWEEAEYQISCIPTISGSSNMVYGTGAEEDSGDLYLYGFLLANEDRGVGGTRIIRKRIGTAPMRTPVTLNGNVTFLPADYRFEPGELFDQGNNLILNDDNSLIFPARSALVRLNPQ